MFSNEIKSNIEGNINMLFSIHGTSVRAMIYLIENYIMGNNINKNNELLGNELSKLEIPNGFPIIYCFNDKRFKNKLSKQRELFRNNGMKNNIMYKLNGIFLGDLTKLLNAQNKVKNQINESKKKNNKL